MKGNEKILQINAERRLAAFSQQAENLRACAEEFPFQQSIDCRKWVKVIWYDAANCGKVITFKAGNPYLPKDGCRKEGESLDEEQKETRRLTSSLSRTRKRIFELAACNEWEWFFTGTLDGEKVDRNDLDGTFKKLSQWMRDYRKATGAAVKYMIVPEQHKDGAWHFHGLIHGLPEEQMHKFALCEEIPLRIKKTIRGGVDVWTWSAYADKFGYSTMTRVRDANAVACYVTKYITKDMIAANAALGTRRHLYYASKGLARPTVLAESYPDVDYAPTFDFENEWVEICSLKTKEEADALIERYGLRKGGFEDAGREADYA